MGQTDMTELLAMQGIQKSFFGVEVLHKVDLHVGRGEVMALCGENGAGKSTLMKILAGVYIQDAGDIFIKGTNVGKTVGPLDMQKMGVSMIYQELNLLNELTVAQNIFLCREPRTSLGLVDYKKMNNDAVALLERLGETINPASRLKDLKIAQKQMIEIAKAISFNVELLIMDEPTSVLTGKETAILFELIRNLSAQGISIIYISHRLKELNEICHKVTVLRDGYYIATKDMKEVTVKDIASLMVGRAIQESKATYFQGDPGAVALEVRNVSDAKLKDVSFHVRKGEILGFSGLVGAGRTELMEVIFGIRPPQSGEVYVEGRPVTLKNAMDAIRTNIGMLTEDRKETGLVACRDIIENSNYAYWRKSSGLLTNRGKSRDNTCRMIERLKIRCTSAEQLVSHLSGGNQQKVALAKWLLADVSIFILDEPTRGVDVGARQEIYDIIRELADSGIAIIIVSSDLPEILSVCERVLVMHEGKVTGELVSPEISEEKIMHYATDVY
jgi:ABC-type sugar transport system ATPase subunit